jgi:hypothetical protein
LDRDAALVAVTRSDRDVEASQLWPEVLSLGKHQPEYLRTSASPIEQAGSPDLTLDHQTDCLDRLLCDNHAGYRDIKSIIHPPGRDGTVKLYIDSSFFFLYG